MGAMQTSPLIQQNISTQEHSQQKTQEKTAGLVYHCACGNEYAVDPASGGVCSVCKRRITPEAIRDANTATISIHDFYGQHTMEKLEVEQGDELTNKVFGHFRIDRKLGGGGMGAVYRALDTSLQRYVAVKVIHQRSQRTESRLNAMLREAVAQARLNHPNVVTIYYVGRQGEEPFLAMELLPGPTLAERLSKSGSIPYEEAIRYAIQVAQALRHAAVFDIVHADIKPANLIMAGEGRIKLSDFGLSRVQSDDTSDARVGGTPAYVAPEVVAGEGLSIQSDMYALGVTLFELVFGRHPFKLVGDTIYEKLQVHSTAAIEFPNPWPVNIPVEFKKLIEKLLAKKPSDRYQNYDALLKDLRTIAPVSTTAAGFAPRAMAYIVDQGCLLTAFAPFAIALFFLGGDEVTNTVGIINRRLWIPVIALLSLIVPAIYLFLIYRGWPSIGRYLFQTRIVEEHGLAPRREQLVPREVLRNAFAWGFPFSIYVSWSSEQLAEWIELALVIFLAINTMTLFLLRGRKALHDYLCHSRVVLAVDQKHKEQHAVD
jgi:uncharacterized RDD family membrane protein YckC